MTRIRSSLFLLSAALLLGGCATSVPRRGAPLPATPPADTGTQINFSDELSRDLIRQTRQLKALKDLDYLVGPDDVLEISIFEWELRAQTRTMQLRVSKSGVIAVPALGAVQVGEKTVEQIQEMLASELAARNLIQAPRVGVTVIEYRSRTISLMGALVAPGVYSLQENVALLIDVLSLAGGPSLDAGPDAYVLRKPTPPEEEPIKIKINLDELFKTGRSDLNAVLRDGDVVYVPPAPTIYIYGSVRQPGGVSLTSPTTLLEALAVAGGFTASADRVNVTLQRSLPSGENTKYTLDVAAIERGAAQDPYLKEGDVIQVHDDPGRKLLAGVWAAVRSVFSVSYRID